MLSANTIIIGANLVWGWAFEFVLGPGHRQHHMALTVPLLVLAAGMGAGYLTAIRAECEARRILWGVRAAILLEAGLAWLSFMDRHWLQLVGGRLPGLPSGYSSPDGAKLCARLDLR